MLCDGFHAAEVLRREHPHYYQVMTMMTKAEAALEIKKSSHTGQELTPE